MSLNLADVVSLSCPAGIFNLPQNLNDMGPTALLTLLRKACCGFLSRLKIHRPRPGLNPRTLGPVVGTWLHRRRRPSDFNISVTCKVWKYAYVVVSDVLKELLIL
jgi:hypothetical protein